MLKRNQVAHYLGTTNGSLYVYLYSTVAQAAWNMRSCSDTRTLLPCLWI